MQFSLHIGAELSLENFSLPQLILAVKELFDREGLPGFLKAFLKIVEQKLIQSGVVCKHCQNSKIHVHGVSQRQLRTSIGIIVLDLIRMRCQDCKKTFTPMSRLLDVDAFARKSREFEKLSLETVAEQSYRRSSEHLKKTLGFSAPHTTLHRWVMSGHQIVTSVVHRVQTLIADGTGYKKKLDENGSNRGEVRVVLGLNKDGELIPYGAWTEASWKDIGRWIKSANHSSEKIKFKPIAEVLVTDGEEELINALKKLSKTHQRCLFHMTYEIDGLLMYKDGVGKERATEITEQLGKLLYLDLPELGPDPLKNLEHKLKIEVQLKEVQKSLDAFIAMLKGMGYRKAYGFVENARDQLYTYVMDWLKTDASNPRVTSLIERVMREIKRRIKKIGSGWSEKGAERMTRLVLLRLSRTQHQWEEHWKNQMGTDANLKLTFLGVTVQN